MIPIAIEIAFKASLNKKNKHFNNPKNKNYGTH